MGVGIGQKDLLRRCITEAMHQRAALAGIGLVDCDQAAAPLPAEAGQHIRGPVSGTIVHADNFGHIGVEEQVSERLLQAQL